jgi:hypothetical protein
MSYDDDPEAQAFAALIKAVGDLQARTTIQHYILQELFWTIAPAVTKPDRFAATMFESISARMEQGENIGAGIEHPVEAEMRDYLQRFFTLVGNQNPRAP